MTKVSAAAMEGFIPDMAVYSLPYVFRDQDHCWKVLEGEIGQALLSQDEAKFLRGLCYYDAGSRNFYTKAKPIQTPDDLAKLKIRVMKSATAMQMVEAYGASPTPIAFGELYSALSQGTVDGAENNLSSFMSNKHYEVCKHFTTNGHSRVPDMLLIGTKTWERLSDQQRGWLQQAANDSAKFQRELWAKETLLARQSAEEFGVTFYDVQIADFAKKNQPMLESIENPSLKTLVEKIQEVE